jgi:hypothetical protein
MSRSLCTGQSSDAKRLVSCYGGAIVYEAIKLPAAGHRLRDNSLVESERHLSTMLESRKARLYAIVLALAALSGGSAYRIGRARDR